MGETGCATSFPTILFLVSFFFFLIIFFFSYLQYTHFPDEKVKVEVSLCVCECICWKNSVFDGDAEERQHMILPQELVHPSMIN